MGLVQQNVLERRHQSLACKLSGLCQSVSHPTHFDVGVLPVQTAPLLHLFITAGLLNRPARFKDAAARGTVCVVCVIEGGCNRPAQRLPLLTERHCATIHE